MTVTLKLPVFMSPEDSLVVKSLMRQQSCVTRSAFKASNRGLSEKEMRAKFKSMNNLPDVDSWFIQSAIRDGIAMARADEALGHSKRIFGSKSLLRSRAANKISSSEWKNSRLFPIYSIGEANCIGNRKFAFDVVHSNTITFKKSRDTKIRLVLPKLKKNVRAQLVSLENLMAERLIAVTFRLSTTHICISYDETKVSKINQLPLREDLRLGLDLNPNYIGCSIQDSTGQILGTRLYKLSELTKKSELPSDHSKSKHLNNKLDHETIQVAKHVIDFALSRHVGIICVEDLNFKQGNKGQGRSFNRLTGNTWKKGLFIRVLEKYALAHGIKLVRVNCAYSSTIGNILHHQFPDPVASSIEVGRRGPGRKFYPTLISSEDLSNRWKEATGWVFESWKELHQVLKKNPRVKYRVPISPEVVFRKMCSHMSNVSYA